MACTQYIQHTLICDNPPPPPWSKSSLTMPDLTFVLSAIIRHYPSLGDKVTCSCPKSSVLGVLGFSVVIRTYPSSKSLADTPHARGGEGTSTCHSMVKWCCAVVASSRPYPRHKEKFRRTKIFLPCWEKVRSPIHWSVTLLPDYLRLAS